MEKEYAEWEELNSQIKKNKTQNAAITRVAVLQVIKIQPIVKATVLDVVMTILEIVVEIIVLV